MRAYLQYTIVSVVMAAAMHAAPAPAGEASPQQPNRTVISTSVYPSPTVAATGQNHSAPATQAFRPSAEEFENAPLALTQQPQQARERQARPRRPNSYSVSSLFPLLFYVALICGLFIVVLKMLKKYVPGHRRLFTHPSMEILGRAHIDQKRYVSLLRVGKRVIVIGVSPDEMRSLSEITDEAEITEIMEVARPKTESGLTIFQKLFQRTVLDVEQETEQAVLENKAEEKAKELEESLSSLRERVKSIRNLEEPAAKVDITG